MSDSRQYAQWPHKIRAVTLPACTLLAQIARRPMTMPEIEAVKLHKQIGCLIWPGKLAEFNRDKGAIYSVTRAGKAYLEKLRADNFLITPP